MWRQVPSRRSPSAQPARGAPAVGAVYRLQEPRPRPSPCETCMRSPASAASCGGFLRCVALRRSRLLASPRRVLPNRGATRAIIELVPVADRFRRENPAAQPGRARARIMARLAVHTLNPCRSYASSFCVRSTGKCSSWRLMTFRMEPRQFARYDVHRLCGSLRRVREHRDRRGHTGSTWWRAAAHGRGRPFQ